MTQRCNKRFFLLLPELFAMTIDESESKDNVELYGRDIT